MANRKKIITFTRRGRDNIIAIKLCARLIYRKSEQISIFLQGKNYMVISSDVEVINSDLKHIFGLREVNVQ